MSSGHIRRLKEGILFQDNVHTLYQAYLCPMRRWPMQRKTPQYRRTRIEIPIEIIVIIDVESKQCLIGDISASEPEKGPEKG